MPVVVVVKDKVSKKDLKIASKDYKNYIKIVVDVSSFIIAIGGEWHSDAERKLVSLGAKQENLWGGGIDLKSKKIDFSALINIRPKQGNESMEILDKKIKNKFKKIVKEKFEL